MITNTIYKNKKYQDLDGIKPLTRRRMTEEDRFLLLCSFDSTTIIGRPYNKGLLSRLGKQNVDT